MQLDQSCPDLDRPPEDNEGTYASGKSCSICMRPWNSHGPHRVCCLRCGHLYGHSCILAWLARAQHCPDCRARASQEDVRVLYVDSVTAVDYDTEASQVQRQMQGCLQEAKQDAASLQVKLTRYQRWLAICCGALSTPVMVAGSKFLHQKCYQFMHSYEAAPSEAPKAGSCMSDMFRVERTQQVCNSVSNTMFPFAEQEW